MLTCVLGEASCERSLAFVFLSKNKSVIPGEVFDPPRDSSFAGFQGKLFAPPVPPLREGP